MNKKELAAKLAERQDLSKAQALDVLNSMIDVIDEELDKGEKVRISGLGTFFTKERASSKGRNPQTGEDLILEARTVPRFKFSDRMKRTTTESKTK